MTSIPNLPPIRPAGLNDPVVTSARTPAPPAGPPPPPPPPPAALGIDSVAYDAILAMVSRAIASLPPGTALSSFLHTVARVTAQVEAQLAASPAAPTRDGGTLAPDAAPAVPPAEAIAQRLAAAFAPDPVAARAALFEPAQAVPANPAEVSARDLALAAAALLGGRGAPDQMPPASDPTRVDPDADPAPLEQPMRDRLYLLDPWFEDAAYPGRSFYCRDCITIDGLLARFPDKASSLEVIRIPYPRPRMAVIAEVGEANQNLPLLVLAPGADASLADGRHGDTHFVSDLKGLLHALHRRHGFPEAHP